MKRIWIPQLIAIAMLLWAFNPDNTYGYYKLLRWVCFGVFAYLTFKVPEQISSSWAWVFGITALVYNPIIPVHLSRDIWFVINALTIGVLIASIFKLGSGTFLFFDIESTGLPPKEKRLMKI